MVTEYYNKGTILELAWFTLSKEEQKELETMCKRLQEIFLADSVGMHVEDLSITGTSNVVIDIYGCKQGMQIK